MGLASARDSVVDLTLKQAREERCEPRRERHLSTEPFQDGDGGHVEQCEKEEEEWCIWEMTGEEDPWKKEEDMAECERIFNVPEVYDPSNGGDGAGPCRDLFRCFHPWRRHSSVPGDGATEESIPDTASVPQTQGDEPRPRHLRGAIKRSSMAVQKSLGLPAATRRSFVPRMSSSRGLGGATRGTRVHFSPLKRVLRVRQLTPREAADVWYQRQEFVRFKKQMTSLVQEDGAPRRLAEAWLKAQKSSRHCQSEEEEGGEGAPNEEESPAAFPLGTPSSKAWWHRYGHSRRGLERWASPDQAVQTLASYRVAVHEVLREQDRQLLQARMSCRVPSARDADKIAKVYHEHTAWSRDLALAAGASDADAVLTNFSDDKRHTREYYLLKQVLRSGGRIHRHTPGFMLPACIEPKGYIDEAASLCDTAPSPGRSPGERHGTQCGWAAASALGSGGAETREEGARSAGADGGEECEGPWPAAATAARLGAGKKGPSTPQKEHSLAEQAKNYPFQQ